MSALENVELPMILLNKYKSEKERKKRKGKTKKAEINRVRTKKNWKVDKKINGYTILYNETINKNNFDDIQVFY